MIAGRAWSAGLRLLWLLPYLALERVLGEAIGPHANRRGRLECSILLRLRHHVNVAALGGIRLPIFAGVSSR